MRAAGALYSSKVVPQPGEWCDSHLQASCRSAAGIGRWCFGASHTGAEAAICHDFRIGVPSPTSADSEAAQRLTGHALAHMALQPRRREIVNRLL